MENLESKMADLNEVVEDLKRTLVELDLNLRLYYDDDLTPFEKGIFLDCKVCQENALDYTNDLRKILKSLDNT